MDNTIAQWISVVSAGLMVIAVAALAKMITGKANKVDVDKEFAEVKKKFEALHVDNKNDADESLRQYRELHTALELIKDRVVGLDKNSLTKGDLIEIKSDIKELVKGIGESMKLIDGMPERLQSLEMTRNKQSEK
jgi:uncharacterized lipoprotein YehR (DUF1307 family)